MSLLGFALSLAVIGLLTASGLALAGALKATLADRATRAAFDATEAALTRQVLTRNALPCPDSRDAPDGLGDDDWCDAVGLVPWRDLEISRADAVDGWGARLSYAVGETLVPVSRGGSVLGSAAAPLHCDPAGITLTEQTTTLLLYRGPDTGAPLRPWGQPAYVLISHGPNRRGAILADGTPYGEGPDSGTSEERINAILSGGSLTLYAAPDPVGGTPAPDGAPFDDRLRWRSVPLLLLEAGCTMRGAH